MKVGRACASAYAGQRQGEAAGRRLLTLPAPLACPAGGLASRAPLAPQRPHPGPASTSAARSGRQQPGARHSVLHPEPAARPAVRPGLLPGRRHAGAPAAPGRQRRQRRRACSQLLSSPWRAAHGLPTPTTLPRLPPTNRPTNQPTCLLNRRPHRRPCSPSTASACLAWSRAAPWTPLTCWASLSPTSWAAPTSWRCCARRACR